MNLYKRCLEYALYVLYACMRSQLASTAESGISSWVWHLQLGVEWPSSQRDYASAQLKTYVREINHICNTSCSRSPPPSTAAKYWPVFMPDMTSPTTEASPTMVNHNDNYCSLNEAYIEPARSITTDHSAKQHKKTLKNSNQYLADLPDLPTFNPVHPIVPPYKANTQLPILCPEQDDFVQIQIFNLVLSNSIMGQLVANAKTNSYNSPFKCWIFTGAENGITFE